MDILLKKLASLTYSLFIPPEREEKSDLFFNYLFKRSFFPSWSVSGGLMLSKCVDLEFSQRWPQEFPSPQTSGYKENGVGKFISDDDFFV